MALGTEQQSSYQQHQQQQQLHRQRAIAPVPYTKPLGNAYAAQLTSTSSSRSGGGGNSSDSGSDAGMGTASVVRRNARERNRVKQVNNGFTNLRQHIPAAVIADLSNGRRGIGPGAHKKLSKVNTLRMAVEYIRRLQRLIDENDGKKGAKTAAGNAASAALASGYSSEMQQYYNALSYTANSLQQAQHQYQLGSPAGSTSSMASSGSSSSSSFNEASYQQQQQQQQQQAQHHQYELQQQHQQQQQQQHFFGSMKVEQDCVFDASNSSSADEDEILDYISLWQDDI